MDLAEAHSTPPSKRVVWLDFWSIKQLKTMLSNLLLKISPSEDLTVICHCYNHCHLNGDKWQLATFLQPPWATLINFRKRWCLMSKKKSFLGDFFDMILTVLKSSSNGRKLRLGRKYKPVKIQFFDILFANKVALWKLWSPISNPLKQPF